MCRRRLLCLLLALLTLTATGFATPAAGAASGTYQQVLNAYRNSGSVPACRFTSAQLQRALKGIDTYGAEYFSDFATAIQNALAQRASGACGGSPQAPLTRLGGVPSGAGEPPLRRLPSVTAATSAGIPLVLLLLAILAGASLAAGAVAALWRWRGRTPLWMLAWRHSWGEAAHRAGAVWLDFTDWIRAAP